MSNLDPRHSRLTIELDPDLSERLDLFAAKLSFLSTKGGGPRVELEEAALRALARGIEVMSAEHRPFDEVEQAQIDKARPSRRRTFKQG